MISDFPLHTKLSVETLVQKHFPSLNINICISPAYTRDFSFSMTDGSATVKMTFGVICACVGFEDGRPSISTTVLGMNLRCAENDNV